MDQDSKNIALASYITPVGFLLALAVRHVCNCQTPYAIFHLRQGLGFNIVVALLWIIASLDIPFVSNLIRLFVIVAIVFAVSRIGGGRQEPLPWVGKWFDQWFGFIR